MARCLTPLTMQNKKTRQPQTVPCGKCMHCIKRRISSWSFRLQTHAKANSSWFVTLTYDTNHVPITGRGYMTLSKQDVQLFIARFRKQETRAKSSFSYFAVGEYGAKTKRPHYHILLFSQLDYTQEQIEKMLHASWTQGTFHIGTVSGASIGYCLKYMCKPSQIPMHKKDDRQPEFSLKSNGLGSNYLTPQMIRYHQQGADATMFCTLEGGQKVSMPRYYKDKIYSEEQKQQIHEAIAAKPQLQPKMTKRQLHEAHLAGLNNLKKQAQKNTL